MTCAYDQVLTIVNIFGGAVVVGRASQVRQRGP